MDPVTLALLVLGLAATASTAVIYFWNDIFELLKNTLMPHLRKMFPELAEVIQNAFLRVDDKIVGLRRAVKEAWRVVKTKIIDAKSTYREIQSGVYEEKQESYTYTSDPNMFNKHEATRSITLDEMPPEIRAKFMRQNQQPQINIIEERNEELRLEN